MALDLHALRSRILNAQIHGYAVANAAEYVRQLGGGSPPAGVEQHSAAHILHLIDHGKQPQQVAPTAAVVQPANKAARGRQPVAEPVKAVEPPPPPAPVVEAVVEAAPVVEAVKVAEVEKVDEAPVVEVTKVEETPAVEVPATKTEEKPAV